MSLMDGRFNEPRLMGNCVRCYYATRKRENHGDCVCARYPKWIDVQDMYSHFCGEFAWDNADINDLRGEGESE